MTDARRLKRHENRALLVFNSLWNEFITYENSNFYLAKGYVMHQSGVSALIKRLHERWKYFVKLKAKNDQLLFEQNAFKKKVEDYLSVKDKEVWISYASSIAFINFGYKTSHENWERIYNEGNIPSVAVKKQITNTNLMIEINLSYHKMIGKYSKNVAFPENFSELTKKQFLSFIKLSGKNLTDFELKIAFLKKHFFKLPLNRIIAYKRFSEKEKSEAFKKAYYEGYIDNSSVTFELIKKLDFLSDTPAYTKTTFKRWRRNIGPSDELKNITIHEFAVAEKALFDFSETQDLKYLDQLVAVLYRPISFVKVIKSLFNYQSSFAVDFEDNLISKYTKRIRKMPDYKKVAVMAQFRSVRESLSNIFPNVYDHKNQNSKEKGGGWGDVIMELSGTIPGNEDKVAKVNLYTFLYRIDKLIADQRNA